MRHESGTNIGKKKRVYSPYQFLFSVERESGQQGRRFRGGSRIGPK